MNTTTPEKCPKCGDELFHSSNAHQEFKCRTLVLKDGKTFEGGDCAKRQRDKLAERVKMLEEAGDIMATWAPADRAVIWKKAKGLK